MKKQTTIKCLLLGGILLLGGHLSAQINNGTNTLSNNSSSTGTSNTGSGSYSFSAGGTNLTTGQYSVALGYSNEASGAYSIAGTNNAESSGAYSTAFGYNTKAQGNFSMSLGFYSDASSTYSTVLGQYVNASAVNAMTIGKGVGSSGSSRLDNDIANSLMIGFGSNLPTLFIGPSSGLGTYGKVGIGTSNVDCGANCDDYRLFVTDGIKTEKVKVEVASTAGWADYVFEKGYNLQNLKEVEDYIKENKHLPNVPSAKEVVEDGVNLGEMDAILLRKIEELTLYIIDLEKKVEELKK
jgi:hypothetical protein